LDCFRRPEAPCLAPALALLLLSTPGAASMRVLDGHSRPAVAGARRLRDAPGSRTLFFTLGLTGPRSADLERRVRDTYDPASPLYRHYLTPRQFGDQFGLAPADYRRVVDFALGHGFRVEHSYRNRLLLGLSGPVSAVCAAFHIGMGVYQRPDGSEFYAPDREPSVDADLPIAHISGLDNAARGSARPAPPSGRRGPIPPRKRAGPGNGSGPPYFGVNSFMGSDFKAIYLPCTGLDGAGQTVALFELDNYYQSDIDAYALETGQSSPSLSVRLVDEGAAQSPGCGNFEVSLDIEMVMAMAPQASIIVYEGPYNSSCFSDIPLLDVYAAIAEDDLAATVSNSWYWWGYPDTNVTLIFQQLALQGQTVLNLAGDLGAFYAGDPASQPFQPTNESPLMTVVGGTTLSSTGTGTSGPPASPGSYLSETTWNFSPGPAATLTPAANYVSGGGICDGPVPLAIPTYQLPFANARNGASATDRDVPDVSMVASGIFCTYEGGNWTASAFGTSASTPLWAGMIALVNQQSALLGRAWLGYINPSLYNAALSPAHYAADFNDIADGSNNNYWGVDPTHFQAVTGYDLCTGLGSPRCNLIWDLLGVTPTLTYTLTGTPSCTPSISPTFSVSPTVTVSPTLSSTWTVTPTSTATATASPTETASPSFTVTPTATISPTFTISPDCTPTACPTASPTVTATFNLGGALSILQASPWPQPNPANLKLDLAGYCDRISVRIYTKALVMAAERDFPGQQAGWSNIRLQGLLQGLPLGVYFVWVEAARNDGSKAHTTRSIAVLP
jgi:subtilase family serine protease